MKSKTRTIRNSQFPFHDATIQRCSEKGFALLQWDFNPKSGYCRYSYQLPIEAVNQIMKWIEQEKERNK